MEPLTNEELVFILSELYPNLSNAVSKIMEIYQNAQKVSSSVSHSRQLSSRDILKFCDRIHRYFPSSSVALSMETVDSIFFEALDCFCVMIPKKNVRSQLAKKTAEILGISEEKVCTPIKKQKNKRRKKKISNYHCGQLCYEDTQLIWFYLNQRDLQDKYDHPEKVQVQVSGDCDGYS